MLASRGSRVGSGVKQEDNTDVATAGRDVLPAGVRWQVNVQEDVLDLLWDERGHGIVRCRGRLLCEHKVANQGILKALWFRHVTQKEAQD